MIILLLIVNLLISIFNAYQVGKIWIESQVIGGWVKVLAWCGAIQSAIGFTTIYTYIVITVAMSVGFIEQSAAQAISAITYLAIIIPAIGTGIIITIQSWIALYQERSLANLGVTAWNTIISISNTYNAVMNFSDMVKLVKDLVVGDDDSDADDSVIGKVFILAVIGILLGALTTYVLVNKFMKVPERSN